MQRPVDAALDGRCSARLESGPAPASPTEGELAAAKAWQARHAWQARRENVGLPLTATDAECEAVEAAAEAAADG
jgi:hypothetical protein